MSLARCLNRDAGSETTATALSATIYYLCANLPCLQKLQCEIRSSFQQNSEMTRSALENLPYLQAIIKESLRIHTPVLFVSKRIVPAKGASIAGNYVPKGTFVTVSRYAANMSTLNWGEPSRFIPERWLDNSPFPADRRGTSQPFGRGSRGCLGIR